MVPGFGEQKLGIGVKTRMDSAVLLRVRDQVCCIKIVVQGRAGMITQTKICPYLCRRGRCVLGCQVFGGVLDPSL